MDTEAEGGGFFGRIRGMFGGKPKSEVQQPEIKPGPVAPIVENPQVNSGNLSSQPSVETYTPPNAEVTRSDPNSLTGENRFGDQGKDLTPNLSSNSTGKAA